MTVPIPARLLAVGDFLPTYGTITKFVEHNNTKDELLSVDIYFFNGQEQLGINPNTEFQAIQGGPGGLKERMPDSEQIRPDLATDHVDGR